MRNLFAIVLSGLVVLIALLAVLGVWDILPGEVLRNYAWKTAQSLVIVLICSCVVFIIHAIGYRGEDSTDRLGTRDRPTQ